MQRRAGPRQRHPDRHHRALRAVEALLLGSGQRTARRNAWTAVLEDRRRAQDRRRGPARTGGRGDPVQALRRPRKLRCMARKANTDGAASAENAGRLKQIALTYKMTRRADPKVGLVVAGVGIVTFGVLLAIGFLIGHPVYAGILGFVLAFLAMAIVFGRRAERAAFGQMEGQPGAAAAVLDNVGRGWTTTPAVAMNRSQDVVHRAVGKAGIVLVGEGNPNRLRGLLAAEKKRMARIVADVPVHDIIVGDGEGQVPLKKLRTTLLKLPRVLHRRPGHPGQRPAAGDGRPDEQHAGAEGPDAQGHADAEGRRQDALTPRRRPADRRDPTTTNAPEPMLRGAMRPPCRVPRAACRVAPSAVPGGTGLGRTACRPVSDPYLDGAGEPVVQAAAVAVPDDGRDDQEQQHRAQRRPARCRAVRRPRRRPAGPDPLAGGGADRADRQQAHARGRRPSAQLPADCGHRREQPVCDQHAQRPVDEEGAETAAERRDRPRAFLRQTEPLAPVTEVGAHVLGRRAGPGEPRSDCLPVVHPTTVLRPRLHPAGRGTEHVVEVPRHGRPG